MMIGSPMMFHAHGRDRIAPICGWLGKRVSKPVLVYEYPSRSGDPELLRCYSNEHNTNVRKLNEKELLAFVPRTPEGWAALRHILEYTWKHWHGRQQEWKKRAAEATQLVRALDGAPEGEWAPHPRYKGTVIKHDHKNQSRRQGAEFCYLGRHPRRGHDPAVKFYEYETWSVTPEHANQRAEQAGIRTAEFLARLTDIRSKRS